MVILVRTERLARLELPVSRLPGGQCRRKPGFL